MRTTGKRGRTVRGNYSLIMIFIVANVMFGIISLPLTNDERETVSKLRRQGQSNSTPGFAPVQINVCLHQWVLLKLFVLHLSFFSILHCMPAEAQEAE